MVRKEKEQKCGKKRNFFRPHIYIHTLTGVAGNEIEDILSLFMHCVLIFFFQCLQNYLALCVTETLTQKNWLVQIFRTKSDSLKFKIRCSATHPLKTISVTLFEVACSHARGKKDGMIKLLVRCFKLWDKNPKGTGQEKRLGSAQQVVLILVLQDSSTFGFSSLDTRVFYFPSFLQGIEGKMSRVQGYLSRVVKGHCSTQSNLLNFAGNMANITVQ